MRVKPAPPFCPHPRLTYICIYVCITASVAPSTAPNKAGNREVGARQRGVTKTRVQSGPCPYGPKFKPFQMPSYDICMPTHVIVSCGVTCPFIELAKCSDMPRHYALRAASETSLPLLIVNYKHGNDKTWWKWLLEGPRSRNCRASHCAMGCILGPLQVCMYILIEVRLIPAYFGFTMPTRVCWPHCQNPPNPTSDEVISPSHVTSELLVYI